MVRKKIKSKSKNPIDWNYREPVLTPQQTAEWLVEFRRTIGIRDPYADIPPEIEIRYMITKFSKET